jgi:hypothetical protein
MQMTVYLIPGINYHPNKIKFKQLMKRYGLEWIGTRELPIWGNTETKVTANFKRDEQKDINIEATFDIKGEGAAVEAISKFIVEIFGGKEVKEKPQDMQNAVGRKLKLFDMVWKPNVEELKRRGIPKSYIEYLIKRYNERRKELVGD